MIKKQDNKPRLLVGYRFSSQHPELIRAGQGLTVVVDMEPTSGPIYLLRGTEYPMERNYWCAHCRGCDAMSKRYQQERSVNIRKWAHAHRCVTRLGIVLNSVGLINRSNNPNLCAHGRLNCNACGV